MTPADPHCPGDRIRVRTDGVRHDDSATESTPGFARSTIDVLDLFYRNRPTDHGPDLRDPASSISEVDGIGNQHRPACLDIVDHFSTGELPTPDSIGRQGE
jgi:hypothetical protein